jgi:carbon-monoxide dehydrogenase medium subunit
MTHIHEMTNSHILTHRFGYVRPTSIQEVTAALRENPDAAILAGGTNLLVDMKLERAQPTNVIDITFVPELQGVEERSDGLWIGTLTSIYALAMSDLLWKEYTALAEAAAAFGSTQIMMQGTLGGNVCNGSPASDTVPALIAFGADAYLVGPDGERMTAVGDLLEGPGKVRLRPGEILAAIRLPRTAGRSGSAFLKLSRVRADLAKVSVAVRLSKGEDGRCTSARIELGSVGPTVVRGRNAEGALSGKEVTSELARTVGEIAAGEIQPIDDVRSTADYRRSVTVALVHDACVSAFHRTAEEARPSRRRNGDQRFVSPAGEAVQLGPNEKAQIALTVNGMRHELDVLPNELLLNVLRERLELTGAKYGCGIGECGACTVWLNGTPVLGCLVLAISADGAEVRTIEGLAAPDGTLDPLQSAFIEENAFQCGYCTPGMLMMTKKLLEEIPQPTEDEIRDYLKGNHCRCTGYAAIVRAVNTAVGKEAS